MSTTPSTAPVPFPELSRGFALRQTEAPVDPTLRDPMENGMETARAKWTRNRRTFQMSIDLLTETDKLALDTFYEDCATGSGFGSLPFLITDPRYQQNPQTYTVRFATLPKYSDVGWVGGDPQGNPAGYRWNVTFQVREV